MPLIPGVRGGQISELNTSLGFTEKPCLGEKKKKHQYYNTKSRLSFLELLTSDVTWFYRQHIIANDIHYPPKLDGKAPSLNKTHTWGIEHGEIKLIVIWKLHSIWLTFIVLEISFTTQEEKGFSNLIHLWILNSTIKICYHTIEDIFRQSLLSVLGFKTV